MIGLPYRLYDKFLFEAIVDVGKGDFKGAKTSLNTALAQLYKSPKVIRPDQETLDVYKQRTGKIHEVFNSLEHKVTG